jgi:Nucleoside-diphosphate-sugar pyrophosphorylase involved in lipopolysaccharide biosynthesis/translation initiation factor 2B, gamma/epsilon subunits (eIF-2Bgamma/eIF-2Bepsilon)
MINVILAAGYATRLYPLTENFPKPLLEIGGESILDRLLSDVDALPEVERHIVVTNSRFTNIFKSWSDRSGYTKPIEIVDDGSTCNDNRIGAVCDLLLAIRKSVAERGESDFMVLAADNVLDFSLRGFVDFFKEKDTSIIMTHYEESIPALQRTGVVCLDENDKVLLMEEKPQVPKSNWAVPPFYIYHKRDLPLIDKAIENGCGFDAPGNLAHFLCERSMMHAWPMPGHRYDIGTLDTYKIINEKFSITK